MAAVKRKVILGVGMSIDGYIARKDGSVDFLFMPKDYSMAPFLNSIDVSIMGRKTFDHAVSMGASFDQGDPAKTFVYSSSKPEGVRGGVTYTRQDPAKLIAALRKRAGRHIWLMGGGEIARSFLEADAVDELYLGVVPVLLGEGIPLFPSGFPQRNFALTENHTYSKGLISLRYERSGRKK